MNVRNHIPLSSSSQELRPRRQARGMPLTQGQVELGDGYQYARVHYSGDQSMVRTLPLVSLHMCSVCVCGGGGGGGG